MLANSNSLIGIIAATSLIVIACASESTPTAIPTPLPTPTQIPTPIPTASPHRIVVDNFKLSLSEFEDSRTELDGQIGTVTTNTANNLENPPTNFVTLAEDWKTEWESVGKQIDFLEFKFSSVSNASVQYFEKLSELVETIMDDVTRIQEETKNNEKLGEWKIAFDDAKSDIQGLRDMLSKGEDYHTVILLTDLRLEIGINTDQLSEISREAQSLLEELRNLTEKGRELLSNG